MGHTFLLNEIKQKSTEIKLKINNNKVAFEQLLLALLFGSVSQVLLFLLLQAIAANDLYVVVAAISAIEKIQRIQSKQHLNRVAFLRKTDAQEIVVIVKQHFHLVFQPLTRSHKLASHILRMLLFLLQSGFAMHHHHHRQHLTFSNMFSSFKTKQFPCFNH